MIDPLISTAISIGLGLLFFAAAYHKMVDHAKFRITLIEYQLLPDVLVGAMARALPLFELALGACWFAGLLTLPVAVATAFLLAVYTIAIGINILRGRVHFDCGCGFGGAREGEQYLSSWLIFRNLCLIGLATLTLLPVARRDLGLVDLFTLTATLLTFVLIFVATNQLIENGSAISAWRKKK